MFWYPFDIQKCTMEFTLEELLANFVELVPGDQFYKKMKELNRAIKPFDTQSLRYTKYNNKTGEILLDKYYISNITLLHKTIDGESVMFVQITLGRGLFTIFLTIYLTTILVNLIGHSSVFYKDFYFEAQVSLNVTVMLVQVTMFTSVSINVVSVYFLPLS